MNEFIINAGLWFLSTVVVAIIVNVFSGIITDPIKRWLDKRSLVSRRKSIGRLQKDLARIERYKNDTNLVYMRIIWEFSFMLMAITTCLASFILVNTITLDRQDNTVTIVASNYARYLMSFVSLASFGFAAIISGDIINLTKSIMDYDRFKAETLQRIAELESKIPSNKQ